MIKADRWGYVRDVVRDAELTTAGRIADRGHRASHRVQTSVDRGILTSQMSPGEVIGAIRLNMRGIHG